MQTSVENVSGLKRKMMMSVPAQEIGEKVNKRLQETASQVTLKGFRPGHVPIREVQRRFGAQILEEVTRQVMVDSFEKGVTDESIRLAGMPTFTKEPQETEKDFRFGATFEVLPDVHLSDLSTIELTKLTTKITEADVDTALSFFAKSHQTFRKSKNRAAEDGDRVILDWIEKEADGNDDENTNPDVPVMLEVAYSPPELIEQLRGVRAGDVRQVQMPEEDLGDITALGEGADNKLTETLTSPSRTVECRIKAVEAPSMPEMDADFFAKIGFEGENLKQFRERIQRSMESRSEQASQKKLKDQVLEALVNAHQDIELPEILITHEMKHIQENIKQRASRDQQLTEQQFADVLASMKEEDLRARAEKVVKLQLIMEKFIKEQNIQLDKDAVTERIKQTAATYDDPQKAVEWCYKNEAQLNAIQSTVLEDQAIQKVIDMAQVREEETSYESLAE